MPKFAQILSGFNDFSPHAIRVQKPWSSQASAVSPKPDRYRLRSLSAKPQRRPASSFTTAYALNQKVVLRESRSPK